MIFYSSFYRGIIVKTTYLPNRRIPLFVGDGASRFGEFTIMTNVSGSDAAALCKAGCYMRLMMPPLPPQFSSVQPIIHRKGLFCKGKWGYYWLKWWHGTSYENTRVSLSQVCLSKVANCYLPTDYLPYSFFGSIIVLIFVVSLVLLTWSKI